MSPIGSRWRRTAAERCRLSSAVGRSLLLGLALSLFLAGVTTQTADAQDVGTVAAALERQGYYIEPGAEGTESAFADLVDRAAARSDDKWYFVSMAGPVPPDFSADVRDIVEPPGNVIVYFIESDEFVNVEMATPYGQSTTDAALAPFDGDWETPDEFMADVVDELDRLVAQGASAPTDSGGSASGPPGTASDGGGSGSGLWIFGGVAALFGGAWWFSSRNRRKKTEETERARVDELRAELATELDELANDVIVLSGPVDLSENEEAIRLYREATATYTAISDEMPDPGQLDKADPAVLAELGRRVVHARWQMDAAEAHVKGDPIPDKPEIEPPPAPAAPAPAPQPHRLPQRQPRPRVPSSTRRSRSGGGGLLDILIGSGMLGGGVPRGGGMFGGGSRRRTGGGMFGGGSRGRSGRSGTNRSRRSQPRSGGGVFGGGSSSRRSSRRSRSRSSSRSRTRSRSSSSRRSSSRRRRR